MYKIFVYLRMIQFISLMFQTTKNHRKHFLFLLTLTDLIVAFITGFVFIINASSMQI